jgi:DNA-binding transcriptional ArsR family regulator
MVSTVEDIDARFAALADATRRAIVVRLAGGEATVGELAAPFAVTQQAISRHVRVLRECGLVEQRVDGPRRPCRLNAARMSELGDWITAQQREWEGRLSKLDEHVTARRRAR